MFDLGNIVQVSDEKNTFGERTAAVAIASTVLGYRGSGTDRK
jgi:hypothetical protein